MLVFYILQLLAVFNLATSVCGSNTTKIPVRLSRTGSQYICPLTIGNPGETFNVVLDSGSANLWVYSTFMPTSEIVGQHNIYDPSKSNTSVNLHKTFNITYGDGSAATGYVFNDTVNLRGIVIKNQQVEAVAQLSGKVIDADVDVILGLSLGGDSVRPAPVPTTPKFVFAHAQVASVYVCAYSTE